MSKSNLVIIPARGGSKGLPRKNILSVCAHPLIAWTIDAAKNSTLADRVIVSTDCNEIADLAIRYGAEVPFIRPERLATDSTPGIDVVLHALDELPDEVEQVILLQPTSPLRLSQDIDDAINLLDTSDATTCISVSKASKHPNWMRRLSSDGVLIPYENASSAANRQELDPLFVLNGAIYIADTKALRSDQSFHASGTLGFIMPDERSWDIDSGMDLRIAEVLLQRQLDERVRGMPTQISQEN
ncbi:acylneuraminate cytidylyltransferase family protein [Rhodopirellula baltica]|uniref:CMP-N-acetylneuraminic acid synthetase n=1 Tax=Rhodopirellula baltica WH47 TaxID=991778 RepID=F2ALQ6_RHOBT|nr:acylneuraminate cytidylyltransferase family protein [Rhodopirellula baltica]EGF29402.1 CMP-N-acetylneuraminic acid synthetase [Rhodopirellula baltica WH47]